MIVQQLQQLLQLMKGQFFLLINNKHFCNHVEKVLNIHAKLIFFNFYWTTVFNKVQKCAQCHLCICISDYKTNVFFISELIYKGKKIYSNQPDLR